MSYLISLACDNCQAHSTPVYSDRDEPNWRLAEKWAVEKERWFISDEPLHLILCRKCVVKIALAGSGEDEP